MSLSDALQSAGHRENHELDELKAEQLAFAAVMRTAARHGRRHPSIEDLRIKNMIQRALLAVSPTVTDIDALVEGNLADLPASSPPGIMLVEDEGEAA